MDQGSRQSENTPLRRRAWRFGILGVSLALLAGVITLLLSPHSPATRSEKVRGVEVVATIPPVADIVRELGGERVTVYSLLPAGASPHTFEPRPSDIRRIATAELVVTVGAGLDAWVEKLLNAAGSSGTPRLAITSTTRLLLVGTHRTPELVAPAGNRGDATGEADSEHTGHAHEGEGIYDPHVWLDPLRVRDDIAPAIAASLARIDPAGRSYYQSRLKLYQTELTELDREISRLLSPYRGLRFIAFHSAWRYMAERYGLQEVAAIEPFPGREPSPAWLAQLQKLARAQSAFLIVAEAQFNPQIARMLSEAINGLVVTLDPEGGGPDVAGRSTYLELMRYNAREIARAARKLQSEHSGEKQKSK
ncbi:MAG: zinc ABC transporter substrate-binding protein [Limnochordales bacterium]|nr:zinc ABC transporter substrate-binding protein [Limnochordales bacterium]